MIPKLYMAPIRGFTDTVYRNIFSKHFDGFDIAVAPFISTQMGKRIKSSQHKALLSENNTGMPVIPQILSKDPDGFVILAKHLFDMGYESINWNLGCPFPKVARKGRGSGMLPFPDIIESFLEKTLSAIPNTLSIKTRLGYNNENEIFLIIPIFNRYPLEEIIIHPRTGIQMYEGTPDLDTFEKCLLQSAHPVVYNGDITDLDTFRTLSGRFENINRWMIGRGALTNPFLPATIKNDEDIFPNKIERMKRFHDALFHEYRQILNGPSHLLQRMKSFWKYFVLSFENSRKNQKKIQKTTSVEQYEEIVARFFETGNLKLND